MFDLHDVCKAYAGSGTSQLELLKSRKQHDSRVCTRVSQETQELYLSQYPRSIRYVVEDVVYLFNGHLLPSLGVHCTTYNPIAALADNLFDSVAVRLPVLREELFGVHLLPASPLQSHMKLL